MLILNNIDAGFMIAPETTSKGERYLGIQRIKIRYNAGDREIVYLPFIGDTLKLAEDYGAISNYRISMSNSNMNEGNNSYSSYQTNAIMDMGQIIQQNSADDNIFSVAVNTLEDLAAPAKSMKPEVELYCPIIFHDRPQEIPMFGDKFAILN